MPAEREMMMAATTDEAHERQKLLDRIRAHQININRYVRKKQGRSALVANIGIFSSIIAAALMIGPGVFGEPFVETVAKGLNSPKDANVWRLLCVSSLIVNLVAAISAAFTKADDASEPIIAEACNAALEQLATDVEFNRLSVSLAAAEYGKIASKILFVAADTAEEEQSPSWISDLRRRSAEVIMPGMAIAFGCG